MKKLCKIFMLIILVVIVTGCKSNSNLKEINYKEYKKLLENKETFALEVMKTGCSACEDFKPKLEEFVNDYGIEVKFINTKKLSKKDSEKLLDETGVSGTPTIIFYNKGVEETVASRIVGSVSVEKLVSKFKANGFIDD